MCIFRQIDEGLHLITILGLIHTENGISSRCVTAKCEDVGVVSSDHSEGVVFPR